MADVHRCPRCELIFASRPELDDHLAAEHPAPLDSDESRADPADRESRP